MQWHLWLGYLVLALLLFRVVWGFCGGYWSRCSSFVRPPAAVLLYWRSSRGQAIAPGHNPLGGYSVLAMLVVLLVQSITGLFSDDTITAYGPLARRFEGDWVAWLAHVHGHLGKWLLIGLVLLHVAAVLWYRFARRHDLLTPMVCGDMPLAPDAPTLPHARDDTRARVLGMLLFIACAALVFGLAQWLS